MTAKPSGTNGRMTAVPDKGQGRIRIGPWQHDEIDDLDFSAPRAQFGDGAPGYNPQQDRGDIGGNLYRSIRTRRSNLSAGY